MKMNLKCKLITLKTNSMKKIGKLSINPEKVIKNEELVNLRGGSYTNCNCEILWNVEDITTLSGACGTSTNCEQCASDLSTLPNYSGSSITCEEA